MRRLLLLLALAGAVLATAATATVLANVSHKGWPRVDGRLWQSIHTGGHRATGTPRNDELLGAHGSDVLSGGAGDDILWGDEVPCCQPSGQLDALFGGGGRDWLYTSHGTNVVHAGSGNDHVWAYYGHGSIDCGPGFDTARVRLNGAYRLSGCERVVHFCTWGDDHHGGCLQRGAPGARFQGALG